MQNLINSLAIFDLILFTVFFIGINLIFYKVITEILQSNKTKVLAFFTIILLNVLYFAIIYTNYQNI
jgi:hypothetical protein